jgi:hypothetical protein
MAQLDWVADKRSGQLRIKGLRGGNATEIADFMMNIDSAYNALLLFDVKLSQLRNEAEFWRRFGPFPFPIGATAFWEGRQSDKRYAASDIPPNQRLSLDRVSIRSPGFWEFIGSLNPLQQLREYLNDRHERRKDREYRELAERDRLELENELIRTQITEKRLGIIREQISSAREFGFSEENLHRLAWSQLGEPLAKLGRHQDQGLIQGTIENIPSDERDSKLRA